MEIIEKGSDLYASRTREVLKAAETVRKYCGSIRCADCPFANIEAPLLPSDVTIIPRFARAEDVRETERTTCRLTSSENMPWHWKIPDAEEVLK